ncbi:MAG: hypothetical protein ACJ0NM_00260 [Flavobacteriaceae bacterium]
MAGKLDTRQKMINMMYLVFIAMLALNIGKEVLATLGVLNNDLESSITELEASSTSIYNNIESNSNSPDYKIAASNVLEIKKDSDDYFDFIQKIKDSLILGDIDKHLIGDNGQPNKYLKKVTVKGTDSVFTVTAYQEMDKSLVLDEMFFDGDMLTAKGQEFLDKYKNFPSKMNQVLDNLVFQEEENKIAKTQLDGSKDEDGVIINYDFDSSKSDLQNRFNYTPMVVNSEGTSQEFLNYNYYGFPVVASLAKLTKMQADIRYIENKILNQILTSISGKGTSLDTFQTLLESPKPVYYTTDVVNASLVLGKKDAAFSPDEADLFLQGPAYRSKTKLNQNEYVIEKGKVVLKKKIRSPGTYDLTGTLSKKNPNTGEIQSISVAHKLVIIREPNSAVVSADNMRVFYRGLRNPVSISIPGVASNTIRPSSPGANFSSTNSGWSAQPTNATATDMQVTVSGVLNGNRKNFDGGTFRILPPPPGKGSIAGLGQVVKNGDQIAKDLLRNGVLQGTTPPDFFYDYRIVITGFDIKVGNLPIKTVTGNRVARSSAASSDVQSAGRGTAVIIKNIKASSQDGNVVTPNQKVEDFILIIR